MSLITSVRTWTVYMADLQTGEVDVAKAAMSKRRAMSLLRAWNAREKECVLFAWPDWAPAPNITLSELIAEETTDRQPV